MKFIISLAVSLTLAFAVFAGNPTITHAQSVGAQTLTTIAGKNAYVHLPSDYNQTGTKKYPLIVFIPGAGEGISTDPSKLLVYGPSKFIQDGNPMEFTVNGTLEKPIVISIQVGYWPDPPVFAPMLDAILSQYRVDPDRVYLTGLSMGGYVANLYVTGSDAYASKIAALMVMHAADIDNATSQTYKKLANYVLLGGKWWGIEGDQDYRKMDRMANTMNAAVPGSAKYTSIAAGQPGATHCCWNTFYDPAWTNGGDSVYTWMLKQNRSGSTTPPPPTNQSPTVNAGTDKSVTLPTSSTSLSGSGTDSDGSISSYAWSQQFGPGTATIGSPSSALTTISNLIAGSYRFRLTVTDNVGATAYDEVNITVSAEVVTPPPSNGNNSSFLIDFGNPDRTTTATGWNNLTNAATGASLSLKDTSGAPTNAVLQITNGFVVVASGYSANTNGTSAGIYPSTATADSLLISPNVTAGETSAQLVISGLDSSATYTFKFFASRMASDGVSRTAVYKIGSATAELNATDNTSNVATIANISPTNGSVTIDITIKSGSSYAYLGVLDISSSNATPPPPPTNQSPTANAGVDKTITLPTSSVSLTGTGTDSDGTIASYAWSRQSGPNTPTFSSTTTAATTVSNLIQGTYVFRLTVTDNQGATATDDITVTVSSGVAVPPTPAGQLIVGPGEYQTFFITPQGKLYGLSSSKSAVGAGTSSGSAVPPVPVAVPSNLTFVAVASGLHHSLAVDNNGEVWTWGWNDAGQAGDGTTNGPIYTPVKITQDAYGNPFTGVKDIAAYYSYNAYSGTVAVKTDGTVWVWGDTRGGLRGDGTEGQIDTRPVKVSIPGNRQITKVIAAQVITALATDGTVWSWGGAGFRTENLGTNNADYKTPHQVINLPANIKDIAGASNYNYAITTDGTPYGWGYYGVYMGVGTTYDSNTRIATPRNLTNDLNLPHPIVSIVSNSVATHAILSDGTLWGWGDNAQGTVGNGQSLDFATYNPPYAWSIGPGQLMQTKPVRIIPTVSNFKQVFGASSYVFYTYALTEDGKLYSWGRNKGGVLGNGIVPASSSIGAIYPNSWDVPTPALVNPLTLTQAVPTTSPYCYLNPTVSPCTDFPITGAPNVAPTANAGIDKSIMLPISSVTLTGSGTDSDGTIASYRWTISNGSLATISSPNSATTNISDLAEGTYTFRLTVTDNAGATAYDEVMVVVNASPNNPPIVNAGADQTITLPVNSVSLTGTATDSDGSIANYTWTKLSGVGTISIPSSATTTVSGFATAGTYTFRLTVTDNNGATATDDVRVIVSAPANNPPVVSVGANKTITLPTNSVTLSASASDSDGDTMTYAWTKASGGTATIGSPSSLTTTISNLVAGTYSFQFTATDSKGAKTSATANVTVNGAVIIPNVSPIASAGSNQTITLPTNSVTLAGSGTDSDGTIASILWTETSGPTATISVANTLTMTVSNLVQGTYVFMLTVTDNQGATGSDSVTVTVNAEPTSSGGSSGGGGGGSSGGGGGSGGGRGHTKPTAHAGNDVTIAAPIDSVVLVGSGDSIDGAVTYEWSRTSGTGGVIEYPTRPTTTVKGLKKGKYTFSLTTTDVNGQTAIDYVSVTVLDANTTQPVSTANNTAATLGGNQSGESAISKIRTTAVSLNVRTAPVSGLVVTRVPAGTSGQLLASQSGWYQVQFENGVVGWISSTYATVTAPVTSVPSVTSDTAIVTAGLLNVRSAPVSGGVIAKITAGTTVSVISTSGGWSQVQLPAGGTGWVSNTYIRHMTSVSIPPVVPTIPSFTVGQTITVTASSLNMRAAPVSGSVIARLPYGTSATIRSLSAGWLQIVTNGLIGYVSADYVR